MHIWDTEWKEQKNLQPGMLSHIQSSYCLDTIIAGYKPRIKSLNHPDEDNRCCKKLLPSWNRNILSSPRPLYHYLNSTAKNFQHCGCSTTESSKKKRLWHRFEWLKQSCKYLPSLFPHHYHNTHNATTIHIMHNGSKETLACTSARWGANSSLTGGRKAWSHKANS